MKLLPARMDAVLHRLVLPLSAAERLQPGDLIPLPVEALDSVELLAGDGAGVAGGRLGQINGMRAVRLAWPEGARGGVAAEAQGAAPGLPAAEAAEPAAAAPVPAPAPDLAEDLPELPPLEFDGGDFDAGEFGAGDLDAGALDAGEFGGESGTDFSAEFAAGAGPEDGDGGAEFDFAAAPFELDEE